MIGICGRPRFRLVPQDEPGPYQDYFAVLTTSEAIAINDRVRTSGLSHHRAKAEMLHELLTNKTRSRRVVVSVYQWESGLGD